jgi:hypothetical protein
MPIFRYFLFASAFVVALLFALDRNLSPPTEQPAGPDVDRTIIRINSARTVPEKIIFDTSAQIDTPISPPVLAAEPQGQAASNTLATAESPKPQTTRSSPLQHGSTPTTAHHSTRTAHSASPRRLYDRQVMVGAF